MEVAVSIGGWGNVVDAYLQLEKREDLADIMRRSDEQQPGRGQVRRRQRDGTPCGRLTGWLRRRRRRSCCSSPSPHEGGGHRRSAV